MPDFGEYICDACGRGKASMKRLSMTREEYRLYRLEYNRNYRKAHKQRDNETAKIRRERNREEYYKKMRAYQLAHPDKIREIDRRRGRRRNGALNPTGELKIGPCEICKETHKLHFDHDHKTGQFRGWLCTKCNTSIGLMRENPEFLRAAIEYLGKPRV